MTREEAKKLLPIIEAYANGETIEYYRESIKGWDECKNPNFLDIPSSYRIKTEPEYRAFNTIEECFEEMQKHQPFGWIKHKNCSDMVHIEKIYIEKDGVLSFDWNCPLYVSFSERDLFANFTFADGTPFGIKE